MNFHVFFLKDNDLAAVMGDSKLPDCRYYFIKDGVHCPCTISLTSAQ